ncbi:NUDIX domain-containing protein [Streptomyces sp. NPDC002537]
MGDARLNAPSSARWFRDASGFQNHSRAGDTLISQEPKGTAAVITNGRGDYLLHLRDNIPGICDPGAWSLLGGGRDSDEESPADAVARELEEEAGLVVPDLRPYAVVPVREPDGVDGRITVFVGHWDGDAGELALTEGVMLHWFPAAMLSRLVMAPWARAVIEQHVRETAGA